MEFAEPERLAWLLLLPVLYLLSLPPRPRRVEITAHLHQWLAAQRRLKRRPVRFRWWRFLLLVGAFSCAVLAHTEPRWPGTAGPSQLVLLVDRSASMAARSSTGAGTVWEEAQAAAAAVLAALPEHVAVRLGLCGESLRVVRGTRSEVRDVLRTVRPTGAGHVDLDSLAASLLDPDTQVWTVTDGLGPTAAPTRGAAVFVGGAADNVGITACTVDDAWPLGDVVVRVRVTNHCVTERRVVLEMSGGLRDTVRQDVVLPAGQARDVQLEGRRGAGGATTVRLDPGGPDALPLDDRVRLDLPLAPQPDIVVRCAGPVPAGLTAAANALAVETGGRVIPGTAATSEPRRAGFLLVDGGTLGAPPDQVRMLSFGLALQPARGVASSTDPGSLIDWDRGHPLTADLDLSDLRIAGSLAPHEGFPGQGFPGQGFPGQGFPGPDHGQILLRGERGPLAVVRQGKDWAAVHLAFRLDDSNFARLAAFPQFVRRCFAASYGTAARPQIAPGAVLDPAESRLRPATATGASAAAAGPVGTSRLLPPFSRPPVPLAVALLLLALLLLALRAWA